MYHSHLLGSEHDRRLFQPRKADLNIRNISVKIVSDKINLTMCVDKVSQEEV